MASEPTESSALETIVRVVWLLVAVVLGRAAGSAYVEGETIVAAVFTVLGLGVVVGWIWQNGGWIPVWD